VVGASSAAERVADVAAEALRAETPAQAMRRVTEALLTAVGADSAIYHEFHEDGWGILHATAPTDVWEVLPLRGAPTAHLRTLHPGVDAMCRRPGAEPFALTDLVSERQWRDYEFRDLLRPACGKTLKMHIGVPSPVGVTRGWSLTRDGSDYSRVDLEVAAALRPVLVGVVDRYAQALQLSLRAQTLVTAREHAVLRCLASGMTAETTGRRLGISPRTVTKHVEHLYRKLGVRDRLAALEAAAGLGLVGPASIPAPREPEGERPGPPARLSAPLEAQLF
jgi:DNA-binding CsgD family transcriptional regulator